MNLSGSNQHQQGVWKKQSHTRRCANQILQGRVDVLEDLNLTFLLFFAKYTFLLAAIKEYHSYGVMPRVTRP